MPHDDTILTPSEKKEIEVSCSYGASLSGTNILEDTTLIPRNSGLNRYKTDARLGGSLEAQGWRLSSNIYYTRGYSPYRDYPDWKSMRYL